MQEKLKLTEEQTCALVESRNMYLLSIGFHSAGLARLQSQLMARLLICLFLSRPQILRAGQPTMQCFCNPGEYTPKQPQDSNWRVSSFLMKRHALQALDPSPRESLRNSPYLKWTELSRALQEGVEEIHLSHVRLHFEVYHGEQASAAPNVLISFKALNQM